MTYIWVAVIVLATIVEASTFSLVAIWFIPSAVISMILSFMGVRIWIQTLVFFVLSFLMLLLARKWLKKLIQPAQTATNADVVIGKEAVVTEEIQNLTATGQVKYGGQIWTARSEDDSIIPVGTVVTVLRIEGVKVIVTPSGK